MFGRIPIVFCKPACDCILHRTNRILTDVVKYFKRISPHDVAIISMPCIQSANCSLVSDHVIMLCYGLVESYSMVFSL